MFGGSRTDWPLYNVDGDYRIYLGFWGREGGNAGGCCHYTNTDTAAWGRKFTMYYSGPAITTTTVTTTTITATTTTNTVLKALHERLEELENLNANGDIKVVVESVKTLESTLESQVQTISSQAEQIVSLKENMVRIACIHPDPARARTGAIKRTHHQYARTTDKHVPSIRVPRRACYRRCCCHLN